MHPRVAGVGSEGDTGGGERGGALPPVHDCGKAVGGGCEVEDGVRHILRAAKGDRGQQEPGVASPVHGAGHPRPEVERVDARTIKVDHVSDYKRKLEEDEEEEQEDIYYKDLLANKEYIVYLINSGYDMMMMMMPFEKGKLCLKWAKEAVMPQKLAIADEELKESSIRRLEKPNPLEHPIGELQDDKDYIFAVREEGNSGCGTKRCVHRFPQRPSC